MCGIVGIVGAHNVEWLRAMNETLRHRGPDAEGVYQSPDGMISLAMRRLSILDLQNGRQPMQNEDKSVVIVFNGEIYNAPEIRTRLEQKGHRFVTTNSDTEALLRLYEEKGVDLLQELNGMFAFVIYDRRRKLLFGARDRLGIKPLYYYSSAGQFAFASELKALLKLPNLSRDVDLQSLFHYMTLLYVPGDASIIAGIKRLAPGHSFIYDVSRGELAIERYWQPPFEPAEHHSEAEWAEIIRTELQAAVKRWTLSDVPIACSLSGGLDSASVVGLLAELGAPQLKTYSLGFVGHGEEAWSEIDRARSVARRWGTDHHEMFLEPQELLKDLVSMVWHLDEPYGGGLPSWYVFREMSKDVKVGLTGTGGDEIFGNYGRFRAYEQDSLARASLRLRQRTRDGAEALAHLISPVARFTENIPASWRWIGKGRLLSHLPEILRAPFGYYYCNYIDYLSDERKRASVLLGDNGNLQDTASYLQAAYETSGILDIRNGIAAVDLRNQLAEEFLFMTDRFSMAHSLEARTPFLDHILVEKILRIPPAVRTKEGNLKYLFKRAVQDLLPAEVLTAPKQGFVIPIELWLRTKLRPLAERLLNPDRLRQQGLFKPEFYERYVVPHVEGRSTFTWIVWAALMFQLWHLLFIEQTQVDSPRFTWEDLAY